MPDSLQKSLPSRRLTVLAVAAAALAAAPSARAIVYREDVTDATSAGISNQDQFAATGITPGASGTLIAQDWVLTAKHVTGGTANGTTTSSFALNGVTYTGTVYADPNSDVSLIHLTGNLPPSSIKPIAPGFFGNEAGKFVWLVGYGGHGPVSQSANGGANLNYDFTRHAGTNIVREYSNPFLYFNNENTASNATVYESSTAPGDSGGPMYQQVNNKWYVIGEVNGANNNGFTHSPTNANSAFILGTVRTVSGNANYTFATQAAPTSLTWDNNLTVDGIQDGAGIWDAQRPNFNSATTGFNYQYENAPVNDVVFGSAQAAAGTVTITSTSLTTANKIDGTAGPVFAASGVTAHNLTFNPAASGSYTIASAVSPISPRLTLATSANSPGDPTITANVDATISAAMTVNTATLTKAGVGRLILSGANTITSNVSVTAGTLQGSTPAALPGYDTAGRYSVATGATLAVNVGLSGEFTEAQVNTLRGTAAFASGSSIGFDTGSAAFTYGTALAGNIGVAKFGANAFTSNVVNTYTGPTNVAAGTLKFTAINGLPAASSTTVASGGTLEIDGYTTGGTFTVANPLTLTGTGAAGSRGALVFGSGNIATYNLTGGITLGGNTTIGSFAVTHTINFNSVIGGAGGLAFNDEGGSLNSHAFNVNFNAANNYAGNTTFNSGNGNKANFALGVNNALPATTVVTLSPNAGNLTFNLGTRTQTISGLSSAGTAANASITAAGGNRLTINAASNYIYAGKITGATAVTKSGVGTQSFTGIDDASGVTIVAGGTLKLGKDAHASVLTNGSADVQTGRLVFDYTGGTNPVATIKSILTNGYASNFSTGKIVSTTAIATTRGLGYADDGTAVTVAATLFGDANLDFKVDFNDFLILQTNFGVANTTFGQGNFNYDGVTDFNDFLALQTNFGQSVSGANAGVTAEQMAAVMSIHSVSAVPEPAMGLVFLAGALIAQRRGRRGKTRAE